MSWEHRNGVGRYYTRSVRVGDRVERQYFGSGEIAEIAAGLDAERRAAREEVWRQRKQKEAQWQDVDDAVDELCRAAETVSDAIMLGTGFHEHRGQWRKKREDKSSGKNG